MVPCRLTLVAACVALLLFVVSCLAYDVPAGCQVETTTGYRYSQYFHLNSNAVGRMELRLRVMAKSDAHIALSTSPLTMNPLYEIVIGASGNNYTDVRRTTMGRSVNAVRTPSLLSESDFRGFWIFVLKGEIEIGKEGESLPYFHWKDPDPLPVHYYSLSSWTNTVAKWIHNCDFTGSSAALVSPENITSDDGGSPKVDTITYFNEADKLHALLLQNYNKEVRPTAYHKTPVYVNLGLSLTHYELDELNSRFSVHGWFRMSWRDERLQWNISEYNELSQIHLGGDLLWKPDLMLYNNADAGDVEHYGSTGVLVYSDGTVLWVPPATLVAMCQLDLTYWPYDTQTCHLTMGSWTHDGDKIDLAQNNATSVDVSNLLVQNHKWFLVEANTTFSTKYYSCCTEPYHDAEFTFVLRRNTGLIKVTIIVPSIVIMLLTLVTFALPPNAGEKVLVGTVNLLIICLFLLFFALILPEMSDHVPFIVVFFSNTLVLVGLSVILSCMTILWTRLPRSSGPPDVIVQHLFGPVGRCLGVDHLIGLVPSLKSKSDEEATGSQYTPQTNCEEATTISTSKFAADQMTITQLEWLMLACALDRLCLVLYSFIFVILLIIYF